MPSVVNRIERGKDGAKARLKAAGRHLGGWSDGAVCAAQGSG